MDGEPERYGRQHLGAGGGRRRRHHCRTGPAAGLDPASASFIAATLAASRSASPGVSPNNTGQRQPVRGRSPLGPLDSMDVPRLMPQHSPRRRRRRHHNREVAHLHVRGPGGRLGSGEAVVVYDEEATISARPPRCFATTNSSSSSSSSGRTAPGVRRGCHLPADGHFFRGVLLGR